MKCDFCLEEAKTTRFTYYHMDSDVRTDVCEPCRLCMFNHGRARDITLENKNDMG